MLNRISVTKKDTSRPMPPEKNAERFPCPGCSADMQFDPASGGMKCPFCGHTLALPAAGGAVEIRPHAFDEYLAEGAASRLRPLSAQALEVSCGGCGSMV